MCSQLHWGEVINTKELKVIQLLVYQVVLKGKVLLESVNQKVKEKRECPPSDKALFLIDPFGDLAGLW